MHKAAAHIKLLKKYIRMRAQLIAASTQLSENWVATAKWYNVYIVHENVIQLTEHTKRFCKFQEA